MAVSLKKGQKVDLTKSNPGLRSITVGLGWDVNQYDSGAEFDLDASAFMLGANGKVTSDADFIFYSNAKHPSGSVIYGGDNRTGAGEGDDEQIMVNLSMVPAYIDKIVFVVNIYDAKQRNQHFGMIRNAFIRLVNMDNNTEICRYNLSENYNNMTGLVVGEIYRKNGEWKFNAIGQPVQEASRLDALIRLYV